eukprot:CAMPEP_0204278252 /NCGR_PEP_ID=MMETSP0468-20130131/29761_1 /ASSEMBLY_ACC=CAM_ASM_000383 /TAXON_ID=2969 /ORGANISM="Oxyrrhis marina" /LENGTH=197 /DNA_ID=CAMNT_0051255133 /DNA_START=12 /DNA_END=605 /DNA_ORIENTATION=+
MSITDLRFDISPGKASIANPGGVPSLQLVLHLSIPIIELVNLLSSCQELKQASQRQAASAPQVGARDGVSSVGPAVQGGPPPPPPPPPRGPGLREVSEERQTSRPHRNFPDYDALGDVPGPALAAPVREVGGSDHEYVDEMQSTVPPGDSGGRTPDAVGVVAKMDIDRDGLPTDVLHPELGVGQGELERAGEECQHQ